MLRNLATATTLLAALAVAGAQTKKPAPAKAAPKTIACPVMPDEKVDIAKATKTKMYSDYKGRRYYFCCGGCPGPFKANPEKYKKMASLPTPKPAKAVKPSAKKA